MLKRWRMFPSCTSCILKITWHTSLSPHAHALQQPQVCLDDDQILHLCRFSIDYVKTWNHWFQLIILNFCSINLLWEQACPLRGDGVSTSREDPLTLWACTRRCKDDPDQLCKDRKLLLVLLPPGELIHRTWCIWQKFVAGALALKTLNYFSIQSNLDKMTAMSLMMMTSKIMLPTTAIATRYSTRYSNFLLLLDSNSTRSQKPLLAGAWSQLTIDTPYHHLKYTFTNP